VHSIQAVFLALESELLISPHGFFDLPVPVFWVGRGLRLLGHESEKFHRVFRPFWPESQFGEISTVIFAAVPDFLRVTESLPDTQPVEKLTPAPLTDI